MNTRNNELRKNIVTALLLAIGFILRNFLPISIGSMKGDLMLSIVFICILINPTFKNTILTGIIAGIITAMTTAFPGGQAANLVDKFITSFIVFTLIKVSGKYSNSSIVVVFIGFICTIVSGTIFLGTAMALVGLPAGFKILFLTVVLPTSIINAPITLILHRIVSLAIKSSGLKKLYCS